MLTVAIAVAVGAAIGWSARGPALRELIVCSECKEEVSREVEVELRLRPWSADVTEDV